MVLESGRRLYLARFYDFQDRLVRDLAGRMALSPKNLPDESITGLVDNAFSSYDPFSPGIARQKQAVFTALAHRFSIISGGPGTGKTSVAETIIRLIRDNPDIPGGSTSRDPLILCTAPTGKAASRFENGQTIHRALGQKREGPGFRHHKNNPLFAHTVIIDEASMIDLVLMTRLLEAIPRDTRVIMIGDAHQLSSVEIGAVFKDICGSVKVKEIMTVLDYNFRSMGSGNGSGSDIDRISRAIRKGDTDALLHALDHADPEQVTFIDLDAGGQTDHRVMEVIRQGYHRFFS